MSVTCIIAFDNNPHGTYFAGQVLTGTVSLKLEKDKLVKALTLNISGFAETRWTEHRGSGKDKTTDTYTSREDYIASQTYLLGSPASSQICIEAGIHVYNFACQLPLTCPSSIEGTHGRVRYMIKVSLVRPWKFDNSYTRCFTVLKLMDLNYDSPLLRVPAHCETMKTYCCWPCKSAPLQLQLAVPQTGFVPGQVIPMNVLITNDSHIRIENMKIKLTMLVTYYAEHLTRMHSRNERFVVTKMMGDPVPNHCKKQFNYLLRVPATPPTCFNMCRIIQIAYQLEVEAMVKGCHKNETIVMPVTIGSVPLTDHSHIQPRVLEGQPPATLNVMNLANPDEIATAPSMDVNMPPPNYEVAVHMRSNNAFQKADEADGRAPPPHTLSLDGNNFTPLYPVFDVPSPSAPMENTPRITDGNVNAETNADKGTWL